MRLNEVVFNTGVPVDGYGSGFFRIGGEVVAGAALVLPSGVKQWGGFSDISEIVAAASQMDVLLVGTGESLSPLPVDFRTTVEGANIGIEPMASPTACRTYNILLSEGRRIGLALLPV